MRNIIKLIGCLILGVILCACSSEGNGEERIAIGHYYFILRVVNKDGMNILDSLKIKEGGFLPDKEGVAVTIVRNNDQKVLTPTAYHWITISDVKNEKIAKMINGQPFGTYMRIMWTDFDVWNTERKKYSYDESYTIYITSKRLLGTDKPLKVTSYVHVVGRNYIAYKQEVNDEEVYVPAYNFLSNKDQDEIGPNNEFSAFVNFVR